MTIELNRSGGPSLFQQLADAFAEDVRAGRLELGERLPSEREVASRLSVSRSTVVAAYRELEERGIVRGYVGRGTFVVGGGETNDPSVPFAWRGKLAAGASRLVDPGLRALVASQSPRTLSLGAGLPALDHFPLAGFQRAMERVLARGAEESLGLAPSEGHPVLREVIARRYRTRPEEVVVVSGAQQGLDLVLRCLVEPGDVVVVDRPGYIGAIQALRAAGATVVGWDVAGRELAQLEELVVRHRPKLVYTNPTFHNPTGAVMPLAQRRQLLALARRHRLPVVEDEPYRDLRFAGAPAPPPSLFELDAGGQIVIGLRTASKTLAAGLRCGWVLAPEAVARQLAVVKAHADVFSNVPTQLVVAELLGSDVFDRHLVTLRAEHERRHDLLVEALARRLPAGALRVDPVQGGFYLWARLGPEQPDGRSVQDAAARVGVAVLEGTPFFADGDGHRHLRLCFTRLAPTELEAAASRLGRALERNAPAARTHERLEPAV